MDKFVRLFSAAQDEDLILCEREGVAYQADMSAGRVAYDSDYLAKCQSYEDNAIAKAVNAGRCALLMRHLPDGASVIDIGAGSGAFVRAAASWSFDAKGFDIMPEATKLLRESDMYAHDINLFDAVTLWDSIEHMESPEVYLNSVRNGGMLFVSVPTFNDLADIRSSKHYRPGEHLYYWTAQGFINWIARYGFRLLEQSAHETDAGRESIGAFAFCRDLNLKNEIAPCKCGGEPQAEYFSHPYGEQWFLRCYQCGKSTASVETEAAARQLVIE